MTDMMLYSPIQKASLSNEYNKLCSHHFKDPVRWGVNVTPIPKYLVAVTFKDPVRWGVNVTSPIFSHLASAFKDPVRWGVNVTVSTL